MIPSIVDHAYCINLDHRKDRWVRASMHFDHHKLEVERFSAVDGRAGVYGSDKCDNYNNACTLSHLSVIKQAAQKKYKAVLIFEDDVILNPIFNMVLDHAISELPADCDMLYLGGNHRERPVPYSAHLFRVTKVFTTHAYIIRNTMFQAVIDNFPTLVQPVDCYYTDFQKAFKCFICNPRIAYQAKGYSDIQHRVMNYSNSLKDKN